MRESDVQRALLARLNRVPGVTVWRNNCGMAHRPGMRAVRFGLPGQADISGLIAPWGRRLEIEVKRDGSSKLSISQEDFMAMIRSRGGIYLVCWGPGDVDAVVAYVCMTAEASHHISVVTFDQEYLTPMERKP